MSNIRKYRQKAGISQTEMADKAGLASSAALCNYEMGRRPVPLIVLKAIRDVLRKKGLKVTLDDLAKAG